MVCSPVVPPITLEFMFACNAVRETASLPFISRLWGCGDALRCSMYRIQLTIPSFLQDPLLGDDLFAGVARSPAISLFPFPTPLPPFPCLADEMEEQAKAMEFEL